jgi:hypothetical protein
MAIAEISFLIYQGFEKFKDFKNQSDAWRFAYIMASGISIMEIGLLIALLYLI